jgi:RimJ/RimL family protein N-acetyltransferase
MIKGEKVTLKLIEKESIPLLHSWHTNLEFTGTHEPTHLVTQRELEKTHQNLKDERWWFITNPYKTSIGFLTTQLKESCQEIKLFIVPEERGYGYGSEAVKLIVDHLFLTQSIERIQAKTPLENVAIQRVLAKNRFTSEGVIRRNRFHNGDWRDSTLFSIIREEWENPTTVCTPQTLKKEGTDPEHAYKPKGDEERRYYTEETPSGPWSRALHQIRTKKPFDENEFKNNCARGSPEIIGESRLRYEIPGPCPTRLPVRALRPRILQEAREIDEGERNVSGSR